MTPFWETNRFDKNTCLLRITVVYAYLWKHDNQKKKYIEQPFKVKAEIRLALRELSSKQRKKVVFDATKNGDAKILAALAEGNFLTTGIDDDIKQRLLDQYSESQTPDEFEELNALEELVEDIPVAIKMTIKASEDAVDPKYIAELQVAEDKAAEAQKTFDESLD